MKFNRSACIKAAGVVGIALALLSTASLVRADGSASVGVGIQAAPGVHMGPGTANPNYLQPVYVQTQPAQNAQSAPGYVQAAPEQVQIYYQQVPAYPYYYPYNPYYYSYYPYYPYYPYYWGGAFFVGSHWGHNHS